MNEFLFNAELAAIAVLHDVIEDSCLTLRDLKNEGMSNRVLSALMYLTRENGQSYEDYIDGVCTNYDAIRVKLKDLEHNLNITRLLSLSSSDIERIKKYHKAFITLTYAKQEYDRCR